MLSIAGMLGPETLVEPKKSPGGVQQQIPPLPRSSPESQPIREQGRGDSPRDRQGLGALLEATGVGCTSSPKGSQSPPLPPPPTTTKMASSQTFTQHGTESTPSPPLLRNLKASASTPTPVPVEGRQKRAPRPQYTKEQEDFIWFCRDDLAMSWRKVVKLYNDYWHPYQTEPHIRSESGLQSRYYRILDFPIKIRKRKEPSRPDLGLIPSTIRRYPWMGGLMADREGYTDGVEMVPGVIGVDGNSGGGGGRSPSRNKRKLSSSSNETICDEVHPPHYNTPTRSAKRTKFCHSNRPASIDQRSPGSHESSRITPPPPSPHQQPSRCTYPRPPDPQVPLGTPMSPDRVPHPRRKRTRDAEDEGEPGAEREKKRRISVTSLCS